MRWMQRKEGSKTFESNFLSVFNYSGDQETTRNWRNIWIFLILRFCPTIRQRSKSDNGTCPGKFPKGRIDSCICCAFTLRWGEQKKCILLFCQLHTSNKTVLWNGFSRFRDLENPKLLFHCTALKGFMLQYSLFLSRILGYLLYPLR